MQQFFVQSYDKSFRFKTKIKMKPFVNTTPGLQFYSCLADPSVGE